MAFKKTSKSHLAQKNFSDKKAQSIFEYFILTAIVCAVVLFFATQDSFKGIKKSCETAFNNTVTELVK